MSAVVTSGGGVHELANAREGKFSRFSTGEVTRDARMERKTADDRTPRQHSDVHRSISSTTRNRIVTLNLISHRTFDFSRAWSLHHAMSPKGKMRERFYLI